MSIDIVADEWDLELPEDSGRLIQDDPVSVSDSGMGDGRRDGGGVGCGRVDHRTDAAGERCLTTSSRTTCMASFWRQGTSWVKGEDVATGARVPAGVQELATERFAPAMGGDLRRPTMAVCVVRVKSTIGLITCKEVQHGRTQAAQAL